MVSTDELRNSRKAHKGYTKPKSPTEMLEHEVKQLNQTIKEYGEDGDFHIGESKRHMESAKHCADMLKFYEKMKAETQERLDAIRSGGDGDKGVSVYRGVLRETEEANSGEEVHQGEKSKAGC